MSKPANDGTDRATLPSHRLSVTASLIFFALLTGVTLHAQLPAGTTDTTATQPQTQVEQDPLRVQASAALDQRDFPAALKLLTNLTAKYPNDAHLLYDLGHNAQDRLFVIDD